MSRVAWAAGYGIVVTVVIAFMLPTWPAVGIGVMAAGGYLMGSLQEAGKF